MFLSVDVDERRGHAHEQDQQVGHAQIHQEEVGGVLHVGVPEHHGDDQDVPRHTKHEDEGVQERGGDHDVERRLGGHARRSGHAAVLRAQVPR